MRLRGWLAVFAVMLGIFFIVTTEILPIGLLTEIGADFRISSGTAGLMMTMPGILAAVAAPVVTAMTGRWDRRLMLVALMSVLAVADFLAAGAPAYWAMIVSRVLVGLVIGAFWSIGSGLAGRLVPAEVVRRATAVIFSAVPLGSVLGVPAGTFIGGIAGWRAAFVVLGVLTIGVLLAQIAVLPALPAGSATSFGVLGGLLRTGGVRTGVMVTALIVLAHFGTYTYVTPFLREVTGIGPHLITVFLLAYGAAGIIGNFLAGATVGGRPRATFGAAACLLAVATLLLPLVGRSPGAVFALLMVWGLAYGAVPVCSQAWFAASVPDRPEAASVVFTSSFQATISIGALLGGVVVDATSTSTVLLLGGVAAVLTVFAVAVLRPRKLVRHEVAPLLLSANGTSADRTGG